MSKITPKNLSYDSTLPPFLQKLQQNNSRLDGRHERAIARPKRARDAQDIEDDAPTYVDGDTNDTLSKEAYDALLTDEKKKSSAIAVRSEGASESASSTVDTLSTALTTPREKVADIGAAKKRKTVKAVGTAEGNSDMAADKLFPKGEAGEVGSAKPGAESISKAKAKKKVKLSFDD